jgi:CheY-like chemotaxis protein
MKKIIFVDDDPSIQVIAKLIFEKAGYEITVFPTGTPLLKNGYELPDVIILDKELPDRDGLEICRELKSQKKTKDIPVIMLSAYPNIKSMAESAGAEEGIEKPFSLKDIREVVAKYAG